MKKVLKVKFIFLILFLKVVPKIIVPERNTAENNQINSSKKQSSVCSSVATTSCSVQTNTMQLNEEISKKKLLAKQTHELNEPGIKKVLNNKIFRNNKNRKSTNSNESVEKIVAKLPNASDNNITENEVQSVETIVGHVINGIISLIEIESNHELNENQTSQIEEEEEDDGYEEDGDIEDVENEEIAVKEVESTEINMESKQNDSSDGRYLIDTCLVYLKQLCYTFVTNHMFLVDSSNSIEEQLGKSFLSLFNLDARSGKFEESFNLDYSKNYQSILSSVNFFKLKSDSLLYLQSFQILNKLLIKMLFFPREPSQASSSAVVADLDWSFNSNISNEVSAFSEVNEDRLLKSFEDWLKSLFVISCSSQLANNVPNTNTKLFEFQSVTLNTIIELIHLSESVNSHFNKNLQTNNSSNLLPTLKV